MTTPRILIFDSGLGGLTVVSAIQDILPDIAICYLADNKLFPYGKLESCAVIKRVTSLLAESKKHINPNIIIIACNTASTTVLDSLRNSFPDTTFLGVVPPIKPAGQQSTSRKIGLLATEVTAFGDYTNKLIASYAPDCQFTRVADPDLAILAEDKLYNRAINLQTLRNTLYPLSQKPDIDTIVLGCTHYPHLLTEMRAVLPHIKNWLDPASGVARHLKNLLRQQNEDCGLTDTAIDKKPLTAIAGINKTAFLTSYSCSDKTINSVFSSYGFNKITSWKY